MKHTRSIPDEDNQELIHFLFVKFSFRILQSVIQASNEFLSQNNEQ